ncbi:MAG: asparagine synthase (glutamine-hydrolyzing) [Magnetococcales bacterium]|nr:asparagine synthase (glutamine-hydrolyzing) [Magnetococcales bacterium]
MCGIAGRLSWNPPPDPAVTARMIARLRHRGPDGEGMWSDGPISLAHRRLAVLDLTPAGAQPMADASGALHITFNGEIYNFRALRRELEGKGFVFRSGTDTEVILAAWRAWGPEALQRFNGMFAFALWDGESLVLARDRMGEKPLFYYPLSDGGVIFASELKALLADPEVPREIDPAAMSHYLSLNYCLTGTPILRGVRKLAPGCWLRAGQGREAREEEYWNLAAAFQHKRTLPRGGEAAEAEAFNALFEDAVRLRLESDVPLGAFLSGGVDSSSIVAAMGRVGSRGKIHTYSAGFEEKSYSELSHARIMADWLGVDHRERVIVPPTLAEWERAAWFLDEPMADTSIFPMLPLSGLAREGVTVVLSGDGGDELFGGYSTYMADRIHRWTRWIPSLFTRGMERLSWHFLPVSWDRVSLDYQLRQFLAGHAYPFGKAHYSWRRVRDDGEKAALLRPERREAVLAADPYAPFEAFRQQAAGCDELDQAMYMDLKTWLVDDILVKVDRCTMAHGLEARAPFLDHRVVEYAASLPVSLKIRGMTQKYWLKRSQARHLPPHVLARRKEGFNAPASHWLMKYRAELEPMLADPASPLASWVQTEEMARLWREHAERRRDNGLRLLGLVMFHYWGETMLRA